MTTTTRTRAPVIVAAAELERLRRTRAKLAGMLAEVDKDIVATAQRITQLVGEPLTDGATPPGLTGLEIDSRMLVPRDAGGVA